jgi:hypothetical protein
MTYSFDQVIQKYLALRGKIEAIEAEAAAKVKLLRADMVTLEAWLTEQMDSNGLINLPAEHGTAYFTTHSSATVAARDVFFDHVKATQDWSLIDVRANKKGVRAYIDLHNVPPPGVNYKSTRVLIIRAANEEKDL